MLARIHAGPLVRGVGPLLVVLPVILVLGLSGCLESAGGKDGAIEHGPHPTLNSVEDFLANAELCVPPGGEETRRPMAVDCNADLPAPDIAGRYRATSARLTFSQLYPEANELPPTAGGVPRIQTWMTIAAGANAGEVTLTEEVDTALTGGDTDAVETDGTEAGARAVTESFRAERAFLRGRTGAANAFTLYWYGTRTVGGCTQYVSMVISGSRDGANLSIRPGAGGRGNAATVIWDAEEAVLGACGFVRPNPTPANEVGPHGWLWTGRLEADSGQ